MQAWYRTPLGRLLREAERSALTQCLSRVYGYRLLQIGGFGARTVQELAGVSAHWVIDRPGTSGADVHAKPEDLPFCSGTMDVVVIVHALEFSDQPHRLLREAERVLAPEGHLLVLGFNPVSLWGAGRLWGRLRQSGPPWAGHYFTRRRIADWLTLLGLEIVRRENAFHRPPLVSAGLQQRLRWVEAIGERLGAPPGAVNITVAQKHVVGVTPVRAIWRRAKEAVPTGLAQPSSSVAAPDFVVARGRSGWPLWLQGQRLSELSVANAPEHGGRFDAR